MTYWLFKTEPESWSWEQQKAKGSMGEPWSGVRNHQSANNMKAMKKGERGFFYHSGKERRIVGIVEVIGEHRPDPTDESGRFGLVEVKAIADMPKPLTLATAKQDPNLADMVLVKFSRLSVQPVRDGEWKYICKLGGVKEA
ncbi:MAG TPA: EVE domain-containing protein [Rhizomicrobium sp.]